MSLPRPPQTYDERDQLELRRLIEQELRACLKKDADLYMGGAKFVITSPGGILWAITVADDGTVSSEAA